MEENLSELAAARTRAESDRSRATLGAKTAVTSLSATIVWSWWPLIPLPIISGVLGETVQLFAFLALFAIPAYAIWNGIGILASGILVARRREGAKRALIVNLCCFAGFALLRIWFQFADVSFS